MGPRRKWLRFVIHTLLVCFILQRKCALAVPSDSVDLSNMEENPGSVTKSGLTESQKNSLLQLHNAFRSIVKPTASNMIRMTWDSELETISSDFAAKCVVAHNPDRHKQAKHYDWVGENIAWGTGLCGDKECGDVFEGVKRWFSESKNYNFITGQCSGKCTLYTQMAWWESNKLGCGAKRCGDRSILVCNYAPGGNYVGQKPYRQGKPCSDCPKGSICDNNLCVPPDQQGNCRHCVNRGSNHNRQETPDISSTQMSEEEAPLPTPTPTKNPLLPSGWQELPVHLIQIDSGMTGFTWGLNARNTPFMLELDNMLTRINGTLHHVSAGQSGVWGIGLLGNIFLRTGITEENPKGLLWERVRGNLKQIDSGPAGVVWGVNRFDRVFCRIGISAQAPAGTGWRLIPGNLKYVSCGEYGCWGVDKQGTIYFRKGVTPSTPEGTEWKTIPGSLRMLETGPHGVTVGVRESPEGIQDVLYRTGVTQEKPEGFQWMKLPVKLSHVTVGNRGIMGIMHNGAVVVHKELRVTDDAMPTIQPEMEVGTTAVPLERNNMAFTDHPSTPAGGTRTFPPTTPRTHTAPLVSASNNGEGSVNKHASYGDEKTQEKDPLKLSPEMANKILHMIQEKSNQFEMTHKAAAQKMQRNVSLAAAQKLHSGSLQEKLISPQAPQPPSNMKNATGAQAPVVPPPAQPPVAGNKQPQPAVTPQQNTLDQNKGKANTQNVTPNPTSGQAFQDALQKLTKATSETAKTPQPANKTATDPQAAKPAETPSPKLPPVNTAQHASTAAQSPHVTAPQSPNSNPPINAQQPVNAVNKPSSPAQQPKAPAETPRNPPVQPQTAVNEQHQQPQPAIHANQPVNEPTRLQPQLDSKAQSAQEGGQKNVAMKAPAQPTPLKPTILAPVQTRPNTQPQAKEPKVVNQQFSAPITRPATHRLPTRRPTLAVTQKSNKFNNQLLTATRPENMHHVFVPTGTAYKPTPPAISKNKHPNMQLFPTKTKYRDEDYDIGLIGRKHLNEISSGVKVRPTTRLTQKPIHTAPVTNAVTVSYELTRSCCAIPDSVCPIPHDCTGYIECKGYNGFYRVCERGKMFHPFKNICDYPRNVDCETIKVGGTLVNSMENQNTDFALRSEPTKPLAAQAPAEKQLPPGSDFMDLEEQSPQRSSVQSSDANVEVPEPRITAPEGGNSGVLREVWFGLGLSPHLKDLINNPRFPQTPDEYLILDKFEAPPNAGDGYGQRLSTYFRAPLTGDYLFYMSCDNECELWLSPDTDELNSSMSIELKNGHYTSYRQWTKYPSEQTSRPVKMEKDKFYFMESFMKEGTGGDNLSIGVRFPDGKTEMPIFNNLFLIPALTGQASADKNLKSGRTKKLLENAQYSNLPVQENYLERPDRVQDFESDLDMFNARKRTSVRRDSE